MNTTATYSSAEHSAVWSRRCSTETIFSIQGKETDIARDTSDTDAFGSDTLEYEPVTESDEDGPVDGDSTNYSDNDIIKTKVLEVSVREGDLVFADSERTDSQGSDSEIDFHDYWHCAQCRAENNNPLYRYCQKCFTVRKNFFPPRPRRKHKSVPSISQSQPLSKFSSISSQPLSQDSGVDSPPSQDLQYTQDLQDLQDTKNPSGSTHSKNQIVLKANKKRRSSSADRIAKRAKYSDSSESESDSETVIPLLKTISDPAITIEDAVVTKKVIASSLIVREDAKELCVICITEPKSGVFVHGRIAHICCCYKCAKKVWAKAKRCPICNCKISNVLKAVVM